MTLPKLHHYVPQFYLRRFCAENGRFWVWDKTSDRTFAAKPRTIAAETNFYWLHEFEKRGHDPLTLEKQFADIESEVAIITEQWLDWIGQIEVGKAIEIPKTNREIIARYIALQFLRTNDAKEIMCGLYELNHPGETLTAQQRTDLHTDHLWDLETLRSIESHIENSIWIFGRNESSVPFWTSDNPVAFKTANNKMWLKIAFISRGTYVVYPLSPSVVLYCHERSYWSKSSDWDRIISPISFTEEMVEHENAGQVFMASRFVISPTDDFEAARDFLPSIGTDKYASDDWEEGILDPRFLLKKQADSKKT